MICFLFVSNQSDNNSWDTAILKFDLEKSKVKVMGEVKGQGHIVHPVSNWCASFSFHINRTNHFRDMYNSVWPWKNHIRNFQRKFAKNKVPNRIPPKFNQVISITRGIYLPCFVMIGWVVLTLSCRQKNFVYQCHSHDLGSRPQKGHPVHFPRPMLSLSQTSKVKLHWFWRENQKSLRRTRTRKRTENITGET